MTKNKKNLINFTISTLGVLILYLINNSDLHKFIKAVSSLLIVISYLIFLIYLECLKIKEKSVCHNLKP